MHGRLCKCLLHGGCLCKCCVRYLRTLIVTEANLYSVLPVEALESLVEALLLQLPDDPSTIVMSVKSEADNGVINGQKSTTSGPVYDPSVVYLLELCTVLALRDAETTNALGADVAEALQNVMRNASAYHSTMVSRTILYLLHLLHASYVCCCLLFTHHANIFLGTLIPSCACRSSLHFQLQERLA